eukprot:9789362-Ditylum_brightwellii.AAC.1
MFLSQIIIDDDAATMKDIQRKEDGGLLSNDNSVTSKLADLNHCTRGFGDYLYEMRDASQKMPR